MYLASLARDWQLTFRYLIISAQTGIRNQIATEPRYAAVKCCDSKLFSPYPFVRPLTERRNHRNSGVLRTQKSYRRDILSHRHDPGFFETVTRMAVFGGSGDLFLLAYQVVYGDTFEGLVLGKVLRKWCPEFVSECNAF